MRSSNPAPLSDEELVRIAQQDPTGVRGRRAASELLGRYRDPVYRWCYRMVQDHELACDLAQESLIGAYRSLARFESRSKFSSWLFAVARNRCLTALRPRMLAHDPEVDLEALPGAQRGPEQEYQARADEQRVLEAMKRALEPREQEALWLRAFEGMPVDEISRVLNLEGVSGARSLLQIARRKLRAALGDDSKTGERS